MTSKGNKEDLTEIEYLAKISDSSSFARLMDLTIIKSERGYALSRITISEGKHLNYLGMTHGAVIFAVADHACGVCGNSMGRKAILAHSSINFFANPKIGSIVEAEARMIHVGKIKGIMDIDVKTSDGKLLARGMATVLFYKNTAKDNRHKPVDI
jgi:acyl-CoA thioesterase